MTLKSGLIQVLTTALFVSVFSTAARAEVQVVNTAADQLIAGGCIDPMTACSLRQALDVALPDDEIHFDPALTGQTIVLTQGNFFLQKTVRIIGPGAGLLTIDANGQSGHFFYQVNNFSTAALLSGLTLTGGNGAYTIYNGLQTTRGGSLYAEDTLLEIRDVEFVNNTTPSSGGAMQLYNGRVTVIDSYIHQNTSAGCGGIHMDFYDQIRTSTIANNSGVLAPVCSSYTVDIVGSTVTGNQTTGTVLGVSAARGSVLSTTITNNSSTATAPTQAVRFRNGTTSNAYVANSIIAGNVSAAADHVSCGSNSGLINVSYSLLGENTLSGGQADCGPPGTSGNVVYPDSNLLGALLDSLNENGGPVPTHAIINVAGNPLIDGGDPTGCVDLDGSLLSKDGRGSRRAGAACDIGAYEVSNFAPVLSSPGDQSVAEGATLTFQLTAIDPDGDGFTFNGLNLSALDDDDSLGALGASLDPVSGVFAWTPDFTQAGNYELEFTVYDDASPVGLDVVLMMVTVGETNRPPVLADIAPVAADAGAALAITVTGSDPDGGMVDYFWSELPAGAYLAEGERTLHWTPDRNQVGTYTIEVIARDRGQPPLDATGTLTITVGAILTPAQLIELIQEEIIALDLANNGETDLLKHPSKAAKHLSKGKTDKAVKELVKFIDELDSKLADGTLTTQQAADLAALAQQAIDLLTQT